MIVLASISRMISFCHSGFILVYGGVKSVWRIDVQGSMLAYISETARFKVRVRHRLDQ